MQVVMNILAVAPKYSGFRRSGLLGDVVKGFDAIGLCPSPGKDNLLYQPNHQGQVPLDESAIDGQGAR